MAVSRAVLSGGLGTIGAALLLLSGACRGGADDPPVAAQQARAQVTVTTAAGKAHRFDVEVASTEQQQQRGLMYRTTIPDDGGMLFAPYPPGGGPPRAANFWMRNTPSPLDILFLRPDGTVAMIAEDTIPFSETPYGSGEPVSAVLELRGGRSAELGIAAGDRVTWTGGPAAAD